MSEPSKHDWSALYQAAIAFQQAAPWDLMTNEDLFAVENPDDGEMGYCSVLGSAALEFGLGVFLGAEGYDRYAGLIAHEVDPEDLEEALMTRSISLLYADRENLGKQDRDMIRSLGLRFRGRNAWPLFQSQQPGYAPWFLDKGEMLFLTTAIEQALAVADEIRSGRLDPLERESENLVLARYHRGGRWHEEWRKLPDRRNTPEHASQGINAVEQAELHLLRKRAGRLSGRWELDIFILPTPIGQAPERPYYPLCFLAMERQEGLIVGTSTTEPWLDLSQKQDQVVSMLTKAKHLPAEVRVTSHKVREVVEPITNILGIKLRVGAVPMLEETKASLYRYLLTGEA